MAEYVVIAGPSSKALAEGIAGLLGVPLVDVKEDVFPDGETRVRLVEKVSDRRCILVQSMYPPTDRHLLEGLFLARKLGLDGCEVHSVIPYLPYARQDREFIPGEVVSAKSVAYLLGAVGIRSLTTVDVHSTLAAGYFAVPMHTLSAMKAMAEFLEKNHELTRPLVVSPDLGGSTRAEIFAQVLGASVFSLKKSRDRATGEVVVAQESVPAGGRDAVIVDDIISTGGSIVKASMLLSGAGARRVFAVCTHPILAGDALRKIRDAGIFEIYGTNSVPSPVSKIDLSPLIAGHLRSLPQFSSGR